MSVLGRIATLTYYRSINVMQGDLEYKWQASFVTNVTIMLDNSVHRVCMIVNTLVNVILHFSRYLEHDAL